MNQVGFTLELTLLAFNKFISRLYPPAEYLHEFCNKEKLGGINRLLERKLFVLSVYNGYLMFLIKRNA